MTIRHDKSWVSVVTTCSECPMWAALALSIDEAEEAAVSHRMDVHGMPEERARNAQQERARRAARKRIAADA